MIGSRNKSDNLFLNMFVWQKPNVKHLVLGSLGGPPPKLPRIIQCMDSANERRQLHWNVVSHGEPIHKIIPDFNSWYAKMQRVYLTWQWRHNGRDGVSNHQPRHCLPFIQTQIKENIKAPVNSPHKWPVTRKMFPFDDVIMKTLGRVWCWLVGWLVGYMCARGGVVLVRWWWEWAGVRFGLGGVGWGWRGELVGGVYNHVLCSFESAVKYIIVVPCRR